MSAKDTQPPTKKKSAMGFVLNVLLGVLCAAAAERPILRSTTSSTPVPPIEPSSVNSLSYTGFISINDAPWVITFATTPDAPVQIMHQAFVVYMSVDAPSPDQPQFSYIIRNLISVDTPHITGTLYLGSRECFDTVLQIITDGVYHHGIVCITINRPE